MKLFLRLKILLLLFASGAFYIVSAQQPSPNTAEILTNQDVVLMSQANLSETLIVEKIKVFKPSFDTSAFEDA